MFQQTFKDKRAQEKALEQQAYDQKKAEARLQVKTKTISNTFFILYATYYVSPCFYLVTYSPQIDFGTRPLLTHSYYRINLFTYL